MMWYGDGMGGWGFVLMAVSTLVFWGALIAGGVALFLEKLSETQAGRPKQRPACNGSLRHPLGFCVVPVEPVVHQELAVGIHVIRI